MRVQSGLAQGLSIVEWGVREAEMGWRQRIILCLGVGFSAGACSTLSQYQQPVATFAQAAHAAATAQASFYSAYLVSECENNLVQSISNVATGQTRALKLVNDCQKSATSQAISSGQVKTRNDLMNALALYADKMQAVAQGTNQTLDSNSESLAKEINGYASSHKITVPGGSPQIAEAVEAALIGITNLVTDRTRIDSIKDAASQQKDNIRSVSCALEQENVVLGNNFAE
jgi:hypothetical protein